MAARGLSASYACKYNWPAQHVFVGRRMHSVLYTSALVSLEPKELEHTQWEKEEIPIARLKSDGCFDHIGHNLMFEGF
jgi:hypothetical protein